MEWIKYIELVRPEIGLRECVNKILKNNLSITKIGLSPLGAMSDSASHLAYKLTSPLDEEHLHRVISHNEPLTEALDNNMDAYFIYDDNVNSGQQALNIIAGWMGVSIPDSLKLNEKHVEPMSESHRKELLNKKVFVMFSISAQGSIEKLKKYLIEYCGFERDRIECSSSRILTEEDRIFSASSRFQHRDKLKLQEFVERVGISIFSKESKSEARAKSRALGDHGTEAMIIFPYNCPTMTIPALWLSGEYENSMWTPLVERTRRKRVENGKSVLIGEDA